MGGKALKWILTNKSNVIATPASRQFYDSFSERTWQTIIKTSRAYVTKKQVSHEFWFYAIRHTAMMLSQISGRLGRKLTTPYEIVHGIIPKSETWFELFSIGYFYHDTDDDESRFKTQMHTMDGTVVGQDD